MSERSVVLCTAGESPDQKRMMESLLVWAALPLMAASRCAVRHRLSLLLQYNSYFCKSLSLDCCVSSLSTHGLGSLPGYDHTIRFWEAPTGLCHRQLQYSDSQVNCLKITPNKQFLAVAGNPNVRMRTGGRLSQASDWLSGRTMPHGPHSPPALFRITGAALRDPLLESKPYH